MVQATLQVGTQTFLASDAPDGRWSAVFEDDGETGYFYAVDPNLPEKNILDAVHIYNVDSVVDRGRQSTVSIVWSAEGSKCALLINEYPHAMFDFSAKRGYCRTNFPNFQARRDADWPTSDHRWSEKAASWLNGSAR